MNDDDHEPEESCVVAAISVAVYVMYAIIWIFALGNLYMIYLAGLLNNYILALYIGVVILSTLLVLLWRFRYER